MYTGGDWGGSDLTLNPKRILLRRLFDSIRTRLLFS